jgi:hypothetical protein
MARKLLKILRISHFAFDPKAANIVSYAQNVVLCRFGPKLLRVFEKTGGHLKPPQTPVDDRSG